MMLKWICTITILCVVYCLCFCHSILTTRCEFHNDTMCAASLGDNGCNDTQECEPSDNEKRPQCFVLWQNDTTGKSVTKLKGCLLNNLECIDQPRCVGKNMELKRNLRFCCCEGDMCNQNFTWDPQPVIAPTIRNDVPVHPNNGVKTLFFTLIPMFALGMALLLYWLHNRHKLSDFNEVPSIEPQPLIPPSPTLDKRPIHLIEIKAQGRFGAVWKAQLKSNLVAVKILCVQDKPSWLTEQEILRLPQMNHPNIVQYVGVEKRKENLMTELWLITDFHEKGSIYDFLKANIISWPQLIHISYTMARGLMHLHEEIPAKKLENYKPAIAHRDFKSKNVLLKNDLTACIADFGLALVFQPGKPCGDTHGQVGTLRYMAPEVLEGAINFTRDSFLRIDMYAFGLVLWELASRCTAQEGPIGEYKLPFEEIGPQPSLEQIQECVVTKKLRPELAQSWKNHPGLVTLYETMSECWDHDAEARLSASCVMERIARL